MSRFKKSDKILGIILIVSVLLFSIRLYITGNYKKILNDSNSTLEMTKENISKDEEYNIEGIENIKVDVLGKIIVDYSSNDKARVIVYKNPKDKDDNIKIEKTNNKLNVTNEETKNTFNLTFGQSNYTYIVKVCIPKTYVNDVEIKCKAGNIDYKNVKVNNLKIKNSAGNTNCKNIEAKDIDIDSSAGNIYIDGFKGNLKVHSSAGNSIIKCSKLVGNIDVDSSAGKIEVYLPENSEFNLDAKATAGSIENEFKNGVINKQESSAKDELEGKFGNGKYKVKLKNSAGEIEILKLR